MSRLQLRFDSRMWRGVVGVEMLGSLGRFPLTGHGCASRGSSLDAALCSLANERGLKKNANC